MEKCIQKIMLSFLIIITIKLTCGHVISVYDMDEKQLKLLEMWDKKGKMEQIQDEPVHKNRKNQSSQIDKKYDWVNVAISSKQEPIDNITKEIIVTEGTSIVLECDVSSHPSVNAEWTLEGDELYDAIDNLQLKNTDSELSLSETESPFVNMKLKHAIDCARVEHSGAYACYAKGRNLEAASTVYLKVIPKRGRKHCHYTKKPIINEYYESIIMPQGEKLVLPCLSKSQYANNPEWIIPGKYNERIMQDEGDGSLIIDPISFNELGDYRCIVKSENHIDYISTFVYPYKRTDDKSD